MAWGRTLGALALALAAGAAFAQPAALQGTVKAPLTLDAATLHALPATTVETAFETSKGPER